MTDQTIEDLNSPEVLAALKGAGWRVSGDRSHSNNRNGYGIKAQEDDYTFESLTEHARYQELKLLVVAGEIVDLQVHPHFVLAQAFTNRAGVKQREVGYTADFAYTRGDIGVVEEVKSPFTKTIRDFKPKWKWVQQKYPSLQFELIEC